MQKYRTGKQTSYEERTDYAFELIDANQGANHYGEIEHYKFFDDGTGLYLFESWHDPMDCDEPDCDLKAYTDTAHFTYDVDGYNLMFERNPKSLSSYYAPKQNTNIMLLPDERQIYIHENEYPLQVIDETINWDKVTSIENKEWKRKQK